MKAKQEIKSSIESLESTTERVLRKYVFKKI